MSKEKYIGKSSELEGFGDVPEKRTRKVDIDIEAPVAETSEEYNAKLLDIREEVKRAKILGPSVLVRFLKWNSEELEQAYDLMASESGEKMTARKSPYQFSDYCLVVAVGEDCKYKDKLAFGTKCKVVNAVMGTKKSPYEIPFGFSGDNYFMLNENLIAWYE